MCAKASIHPRCTHAHEATDVCLPACLQDDESGEEDDASDGEGAASAPVRAGRGAVYEVGVTPGVWHHMAVHEAAREYEYVLGWGEATQRTYFGTCQRTLKPIACRPFLWHEVGRDARGC